MLYATGTASSGVSVFIQNDRLVFDYNVFGEHHVIDSDRDVPTGPSIVGLRFRRIGDGGNVTLVVDGQDSGAMEFPFTMRIISSLGMSIGRDHGSPVSERYSDSFPFAGTLSQVDIQLVSAAASDASAAARAGMGKQ